MHLQSGHGLEDAALVQAGAKSVVGVDYSTTAARAAQQRAGELTANNPRQATFRRVGLPTQRRLFVMFVP